MFFFGIFFERRGVTFLKDFERNLYVSELRAKLSESERTFHEGYANFSELLAKLSET